MFFYLLRQCKILLTVNLESIFKYLLSREMEVSPQHMVEMLQNVNQSFVSKRSILKLSPNVAFYISIVAK